MLKHVASSERVENLGIASSSMALDAFGGEEDVDWDSDFSD